MSDMNNIKKILICVELEDNTVRQVLASKELKHALLHMLKDENNTLRVSDEIMPIEIKLR
jgi:hypothetical protein